ncbi:hypothetical protein BU24DRAFT_452266 [Aaosphaeria arxii CBS 175.79]|uniref:Uncharacterized protein n=1 Tax=Aaosphaeria arxii CBS 175.79 TaxID=1450172 RepID=A0A6A5XLZ1_9PLEO|nr:uncharacterized protein BU24DRAFT_452266 [Aaosphaeria arxii CBS 175.79]KAF2013344.1 hypothetical protein BU24DRAFT_452266 [Aaosphaeria arxii CBS 175.79]
MSSQSAPFFSLPSPSNHCPRTSSVSPTRSQEHHTYPERKRKRKFGFSHTSRPAQSIKVRRRAGFFTKLSRCKNSPTDIMAETIVDPSLVLPEILPIADNSHSCAIAFEAHLQGRDNAVEERRRGSTMFGSFSTQLKSILTSRHRRFDSPPNEDLSSYHFGRRSASPLKAPPRTPSYRLAKDETFFQLPNTSEGLISPPERLPVECMLDLEACAIEGSLRFAWHSTELLQCAPGPSDYWRSKRYHGRRCQFPEGSAPCEWASSPFDVYPEPFNGPPSPHIPSSSFSPMDLKDSQHCSIPNEDPLSHESAATESEKSPFFLPLFLVPFRRKKSKSKGKQALSRCASYSSAIVTTSANVLFGDIPNHFGPVLGRQGCSITIDDMGILQNSDAASIADSNDIPHAPYKCPDWTTEPSGEPDELIDAIMERLLDQHMSSRLHVPCFSEESSLLSSTSRLDLNEPTEDSRITPQSNKDDPIHVVTFRAPSTTPSTTRLSSSPSAAPSSSPTTPPRPETNPSCTTSGEK